MEVEEGAGGGGEEGGTAAGDRRPRGRGHRGRGRSRDRDRSRGRGRGRCWPSLVKSPKQFQRFGYYSPVAVRRRSLQLSLSPVKSRGRGISRLAADRVLVAPLLGEPQQPDEDTEGQQPNEDTEGQQQDDTEGRQQHAASTSAAGPQDDDQQEGHPSYPGPRKRRRLHGVRTFTCSQEDPKVEIKQEPVRKSVFDRIGPKVERGCAEQTRVKSAVVKIERGQVYDFVPESKVKSYIVPYAHDGESDAESSESAESKVKTEPKPEAELKVRTRPIAEPKEKPEPKVKDRLVAEPKVKPEHKAKDRSVAEAKVKTEPQVKDRSVAEPKVKPEPKDRSVAEPKEKPEPKAKDSSVAEAKVKTEAKVKDRSVAEAKPEPAAHSYADAAAGRSDTTAGAGEQTQGTKELVLGIDLGTTNSVVAVVQDGDVEVLVNDICNRLTPSCVHYSDVRQVGEGALRLAITDPDKTVRNIKRALGRSHADLVADATQPLGPVKVALDPTNKRNALIAIEGELLPPEEVAATLLMELKKAAEAQLGCAVGKAVIAVPTYFNTAQRQAVIDAGYLAGLKVSQLVNEPTAAAMAYAHGRNFNKEIVVVDVGGGGCSVSVVCVQNDAVGVRASTSERLPGGEDFDGLMVEHIKQMIKSTLSKDVADDRSYEILRSNFERSKQKLSRIPLSTISTFLPGVDVECNIDVKREMFESVCGGSFKVIASAVKSIVKASKVPVIGEVILIGGSTRIPLLRSLIQDELGAKIGKAVNPDEAVAKGAALLGAGSVSLLQELVCAKTTLSTDNMSYSLKGNIAIPRDLDADIFKKVLKILQDDTPVIRWNPISLQIQPRININGVFEFIDPGGRKVHTVPIGCLSYRARKKCFEKLRDQAAQEQLEHDRVNEKNLLENALREQLCNEVGEPLYSVEHSEKVAQKLKWLEENPHASLIEILKHKEDLHQSNIFWKQEMARRKEEECKSKLVTVFHNILDRKICEDDVARDLEKKLRDRCADFFERIRNGVVKGVKEYEAIFETISKESSDLDAERLKRQVILRNLDDKLRAVMFVDERDPVFQEAKMFQEKWAKRWEWVQRNPVDTADNLQHYFTQVSEDLLRLAILREAVTKKLSVEEAVNVNQFTREDDVDATQEPNQDRPVDNLAVIWDKMILAAGAVNHIQTEASPSPSTSESTLLSCLSRALAVQLLREAQDAVLLIIQTATVRCGLAALALRFADATGEAVERLLLVRRVNVLANPGEEGNLLAHDFLRLCDKSRVNWREVVIGLNTDTVSDKTAAAFVARLRQSAAAAGAGEMPVVASGALPLDEKVVMRLHEAAAMDRFDGEISLAVSEVFCGLDSLRTLFVVGGRWFPLLQNHCRGLEDGVDPWVTYESSLLFLHTYRQGVCTALKQVAWRDVSFQKQALHLWGEIQSDWVQSYFWCVVELFVDLFENTTKKFSPGLLFEERCRLALLASDDSRLKLDLLNKLRCSVSAGQAWGQADERYLSLVVNLCVDTTLSVLEQYKEGLRWSYPLFENLLPFVARGTTRRRPAEPLPPIADPQLAAELHRLKEGFLGTQHPAFPSPQALLLHCSGAGHFSTISKSLRQLFALPIQPPSKGWRATDQLSTITRRLSTCSPDCLPDAIVVASSPRGAQDKRILKLAVQIFNQVT